MNVKELRKALENLPDDMEVILQKDAEGNNYSPLHGADSEVIYVPYSTWSGEVYSVLDVRVDDNFSNRPRAIVLYPVN